MRLLLGLASGGFLLKFKAMTCLKAVYSFCVQRRSGCMRCTKMNPTKICLKPYIGFQWNQQNENPQVEEPMASVPSLPLTMSCRGMNNHPYYGTMFKTVLWYIMPQRCLRITFVGISGLSISFACCICARLL